MTEPDIFKKIADYFAPLGSIKIVGVYGSFAANKAQVTSDVDIAIASDAPLSPDRKFAMAAELSLLLKREIDLLDLQSASGLILKEAIRSSRWVKRTDPILLASVLKRVIYDQADFFPLYERMLKAKRERFLKS